MSNSRYSDTTGSRGKLCSSGKYQDDTAMTSASACKLRQASTRIKMAFVKNCPKGQYQSQTGRTGCVSVQQDNTMARPEDQVVLLSKRQYIRLANSRLPNRKIH